MKGGSRSVCRGGGGSLCVCVCSQGFDTAIQALWLPWCRLPYMAIGVKEQREWAVWGSMHTHTQTHTGRMWRISLLRDAESMTSRPQKPPRQYQITLKPCNKYKQAVLLSALCLSESNQMLHRKVLHDFKKPKQNSSDVNVLSQSETVSLLP